MLEKLRTKTYNFLRWSQKYTKTDMVYLAKGGFWLTLGQGISSISAFILAIAFANLLPKETYGNYKYILSIVSLLSIPTLSGINTSLTRSVARGFEGAIVPAIKTKIKWGFIGSIASILLAIYYFISGNIILTISFLIAGIFIPLFESFTLYTSFLSGKKLFDKLTKYNIFTKIVTTTFMVLTIFLTDSIPLIILSYFFFNSLTRFILILRIFQKYKINKKEDHEVISYGKHLSLIKIIGTLSMQIDKILVFHYFGATNLAIYSFAIIPVEQIKGILKNFQTIALPKFAQKNIIEIKQTILPKIFKLSFVIFIGVIIYIILAPYLFHIFLHQYTSSIFYSQLFSVSLVTIPLLIILSVFQAQKMTKTIYEFQFYSSIFQILFIFLGIHLYGIVGLIISRIVARFFNLFLTIYQIKKN